MSDMRLVRPERSNWRDQALSERHRRWGWDCPAADIDFLLNEYDVGETVAIIEYKNECAPIQWTSHPSYRALINLGTAAGISIFAVRYASDFSWYKVTPLNGKAKEYIAAPQKMNEEDYVRFLYRIRGRLMPQGLLDAIEL